MTAAQNKQILAKNLWYFMERKGKNQQQLCADLDMKYTTVSDWLNAKTYPRIEALQALADYFGCEKSDLMEDRLGKPAKKDDGLSEKKRALIQFAETVPEDKVDMMLRVMRTIAEGK
jgi:transcriptional regulator with XRE-family HTH domain